MLKYGDAVPITQGLADNPSIRYNRYSRFFQFYPGDGNVIQRERDNFAPHMALVPMVIEQTYVVSALLISILVYLRNASFFDWPG